MNMLLNKIAQIFETKMNGRIDLIAIEGKVIHDNSIICVTFQYFLYKF